MVTQLRAPKGGTRIGGRWYQGGQTMPSKYRRLDEKSTRPHDPASGMLAVAPNMGRSTLPHLMRFSGMIQTLSRSYRHADEAMQDSIPNAHMMLNDPMITEPLFQRIRKTSLLEWHIEVPDENDEEQKALKKELTRLVEAVPRFTDYRFDLLMAVWFGRYGVEHTYKTKRTPPTEDAPRGYRRYVVKNWTPVDGDKLVFRYDDGRGDYDPEQFGIRVSPALAPRDLIAGERRLEATADGLAYFLEPWEQRFWSVHKHLLLDGHWEDPITAGRIHGVGLRSFVYWLWIQKQEALAQLCEIVETSARGIWIYWYPAGNPVAHDEVEKIAAERAHTNVILMPRDVEGEQYGVEQIPFDGSGAQVLKELIDETYAHLIKRLILGQTLSSEADATGMGSGLADLQGETMADIIRFDAKKLEETITNGLVLELRDRNFPAQRHIDVKFKIDVDSEEPEKALDAIERAWNMGAEIAELELMEKAGITPPKPGDKVLQNPVILQQMRLAEQHMAGGGGGQEQGDLMSQLMGDAGGDMGGMPGQEAFPAEGEFPPEEEPQPFEQGSGAQRGPEMFAKQPKSSPGQGGLFDEEKHPRKPEGEGGGQFTSGTGTAGAAQGTGKRVRLPRFKATDINAAIAAAQRMERDGPVYVSAGQRGFGISQQQPPGNQDYYEITTAGDVKPHIYDIEAENLAAQQKPAEDWIPEEIPEPQRGDPDWIDEDEPQAAKHSRATFSYRYFRRGSYNVTPADDGLVISQT